MAQRNMSRAAPRPGSAAIGPVLTDDHVIVKGVICTVVKHTTLNVNNIADSVATTLSSCSENNQNDVIRGVALQEPKIQMAAQIMVKNLNTADRKTLETQVRTRRKALKRSKQKIDYVKELDSLWGSRDAWLPPMYRSNRHEIPGLNILVCLRSITQKAVKLSIRLSSLWEEGGDLLEAARRFPQRGAPILTAKSAEAANKDFFRHHGPPEVDQPASSDDEDEDADIEAPPAEAGRLGLVEHDHRSSPASLEKSDNFDDDSGFFEDFSGFVDLGSDDDSDLGAGMQFNVADMSFGPVSAMNENATPVPDATPDISVIIEDDVDTLPVPVEVTTAEPDPIVTERECATGPPGVHLSSTSVALFMRIQEQLSNNVCLYDDVLWYTLWSAMPSTRELSDRKIILVDPLLLSVDAWRPGGMGPKLPKILQGKLALCTIYAPVHHRDSGHWTAVQVVVGASQITINHFDSLFSAQRSLRVKRLFDSLFREACPGSEVEFVEAACPQQLDSVSCGVYTIGVTRRLVYGKCIPRYIDQDEERQSLLALLSNQQALRDTLEQERGARLCSRNGRLALNSISSVSSNSLAPNLPATGNMLKTVAQHPAIFEFGSTSIVPSDVRPSAGLPDQTLDLVARSRKRTRPPSPEEEERPAKHIALADWARTVSKQATTFARSDNVIQETVRRVVRTRHEQVTHEGRLSAANIRVCEATTALEESNEKVAAADFLDAVQEAARLSANRIARRTGDASHSKVLETINAGTVLLTASLRGTGPSMATPNEPHKELARAEEELQVAVKSVTEETQALEVAVARKRQDEVFLREQEGLQLVLNGLAKIHSPLES